MSLTENYSEILQPFGLLPEFRGPWATFGHSARKQGWKIHLSCIPTHVGELLASVLPVLREFNVSFKIARDASTLRQLNEGALGDTQIGKFLTIYPGSDEEARLLATQLVTRTEGFQGPVVMTDLRLGDIVYARYGAFNPSVIRDRLGQTTLVIDKPDGTPRVDDYAIPFVSPEGVSNPFEDFITDSAVRRPTSDSSTLFGPGYLLLEVVRSSPKGAVFLALNLSNPGQVSLKIIKEGRQHCLSDGLGRDIRTRLRRQELLHRQLQGIVPIPAVEPYFEVAGNGYLPQQYIDGHDIGTNITQPFGALSAKEQRLLLTRAIDLTSAVESLHAAGYVHRDLAPTNVRVSSDNLVYLLDLELAHAIADEEQPFSQGTPGFMSPQQQAGDKPAFSDDIYSLGCLLLFLLSGIDPRRITFATKGSRLRQIRDLTGCPEALAEMLAQCLRSLPHSRPSVGFVKQILIDTCDSVNPGGSGTSFTLGDHRPNQVRRTAARLLKGAAEGLLTDVIVDDASGLWLSAKAGGSENAQQASRGDYFLQRSTNRGVSGVVYVLARLARCGLATETVQPKVEKAVDWLLSHAPTSDDQLPGLHFGEAGVAVAITEAVHSRLITSGKWLDEYLVEALSGPLDWPDLTHGAAGQGIAAFLCADLLHDSHLAALSHRCADYLIKTQDSDGGWTMPQGVEGMSGGRYTGFAHGVAGIVYFLAEYAARFRCLKAERSWRLGSDWLISRARTVNADGVMEWPIKDGDQECWQWWCHGGPGIALTFLRLFEHTGNKSFADVAGRALEGFPLNIRHANLSQCHGLSGVGESYLEAARVLGDAKWLTKAAVIGNVLNSLARESRSGSVTWLVEDPKQATADLMVGAGGVAHFLLRFASATQLSAPLLPDSKHQTENL